jgi:hypothetical protein
MTTVLRSELRARLGDVRDPLQRDVPTEEVTQPLTSSSAELSMYKGRPLFSGHRAFTQFLDDFDSSMTAMVRWLRDNGKIGPAL